MLIFFEKLIQYNEYSNHEFKSVSIKANRIIGTEYYDNDEGEAMTRVFVIDEKDENEAWLVKGKHEHIINRVNSAL